MDNLSPNIAGQKKRVVLRVRKKIPAEVFLKGHLYKNVYLNDLSTTGFSLNISKSDELPDFFELRFRLKLFSKAIKIQAAVKNRSSTPAGFRIGCSFLKPSEEDKNLIGNYLSKYVDFYLPRIMVNTTAFLFLIDALWRLLAYAINFYYSGTEFAKDLQTIYEPDSYGIILLLYVINASVAFIFTDRIINRENKGDFVLSILYIVPAYIFILMKNIGYWELGFWQENCFFIKVFLLAQISLIFFAGYSILRGAILLRRIDVVLDSIESHIPILR